MRLRRGRSEKRTRITLGRQRDIIGMTAGNQGNMRKRSGKGAGWMSKSMLTMTELRKVFYEKLAKTDSLDAAFVKATWVAFNAGLAAKKGRHQAESSTVKKTEPIQLKNGDTMTIVWEAKTLEGGQLSKADQRSRELDLIMYVQKELSRSGKYTTSSHPEGILMDFDFFYN